MRLIDAWHDAACARSDAEAVYRQNLGGSKPSSTDHAAVRAFTAAAVAARKAQNRESDFHVAIWNTQRRLGLPREDVRVAYCESIRQRRQVRYCGGLPSACTDVEIGKREG